MKKRHNPKSNNLTLAAQKKGGLVSAQRRRARAMAALDGLSPVQIYRKAFGVGWHAGARSARRRLGLVA